MSAGVSVSTARRLLAVLAAEQATGRLPSVVAAVVRDGDIVWRGSRGGWALEDGAQVADPFDVQYRIGSITKTMTAVLVLQLAHAGRLDLDEPVSRWLGEATFGDRSLRSLLSHAAGVPAEPAGSWWERSPGQSWEELQAENNKVAAPFPDHQQFHYSNLAYALLGQVVAREVGVSWWECVQQRILTPLGMTRTTYLPEQPAAQGWSVHPWEGTLDAEPSTDTAAMAPAGQLWSTADDLASYAAFLAAGHPDLLTRAQLEQATHPQSGVRQDLLSSAHGLGFQLVQGGSGMLVGHSGSMPGFLACCFVDRVRRTGVAVLSNATSGMSARLLGQRLLEELEACEPTVASAWEPAPQVLPEFAEVVGLWHWGNLPLLFSAESEEIRVRTVAGVETGRFRAESGRIVGVSGYHDGEELTPVRASDGGVSHLEISTFVFTRTPYDPAAPAPGGHPSLRRSPE